MNTCISTAEGVTSRFRSQCCSVVQKNNKIIPALYKNTFKGFSLVEHSQMRDYYKSEEQLAGLLGNADRGIIIFPLYRWGTWIFASAYKKPLKQRNESKSRDV